eukprot:Blabericola_migrator_1__12497@NODE_790_length_6495_cov_70_128034_g559_i0_p4_GENE_NODE_790_length_6495_cov_70_128034_g559_i0NODE_790_length_6495_cov_70_128034_g559_i0_p4_ORF_typecomplete_len309_score32_65_NODE_790_length_6495_cov_70_128034_g559_i018962822
MASSEASSSPPYMIYVLDDGAPESTPKSFLGDLNHFGVAHVQVFTSLETMRVADSKLCPQISYLVCSAAKGQAGVVAELEVNPFYSLKGVLLFCGPYEDFYAKWALQHRGVVFLSHNMRELRRAVVWLLAGGSFAANGDAIPPKKWSQESLERRSARRPNVPNPRALALLHPPRQPSETVPRLIQPGPGRVPFRRPRVYVPEPPPALLPPDLETSLLEELRESIHRHQLSTFDSFAYFAPNNGQEEKRSSHRASTETTASFTSSNIEDGGYGPYCSSGTGSAPEGKLNEIAQLVALFEALRLPDQSTH